MRNKTITPLFIALFLLTLMQGCNKETNPKCGPNKKYDLYLFEYGAYAPSAYTYMDGNNRVYQWGDLVEHVCPDEHVKVSYRVRLHFSLNSRITARGRISWSLLFERQFSMSPDGLDLKGNGEAGLKQAFGENEASFIPILEVLFPTRGNRTDDDQYLKENVQAVEIIAEYLDYKY